MKLLPNNNDDLLAALVLIALGVYLGMITLMIWQVFK